MTIPEKVGRPAIDHTGDVFGRLTVLRRAGSRPQGGGKPRWVCQCECGNIVDVPGARLRSGDTRSCGCFRRDRAGNLFKSHGKSKTLPYMMFYDARKRAHKLNLPFDIEPEDIRIPDVCPVLGITLNSGARDSAASLDRILPEKGYVRGNICVISFRANRLKSDATADELRRVLAYVEGAA